MSFYIDANVKLRGDPARLRAECAAEPLSFFCFRHPERDCLYAEAELVIRQDYDDERRVREQIDHYRMAGFPGHSGLIAGGALLRRHHEAEVIGLGEEWYEHVLRFSKRDQLSFNFVAWRRAFRHGFLPGGLRDNPFIQMTATALIPLVAIFGAPEPERISAVLALVALILEGAQQLNQYQQNWIGYRSTCEALKHEKHLYLAGAGPYAGANDALLLLADRVEGLISQEHAKWVSVQEHAMRTGKTQLSRIS